MPITITVTEDRPIKYERIRIGDVIRVRQVGPGYTGTVVGTVDHIEHDGAPRDRYIRIVRPNAMLYPISLVLDAGIDSRELTLLERPIALPAETGAVVIVNGRSRWMRVPNLGRTEDVDLYDADPGWVSDGGVFFTDPEFEEFLTERITGKTRTWVIEHATSPALEED